MREKKRGEASMGGVGVGVGGGGSCCYFHPKEVVVGVCPVCLHEKLITLLASSSSSSSSSKQKHQHSSKSIINLFTFPSLLNPLHLLRPSNSSFDLHPHDLDSQEDSFISMKFEDNGAGSWENKNSSISKTKTKHKQQQVKEEEEEEEIKNNNNSKSLVGHAKTRGTLRWRKRIGQMLQLIRWKKRSNVCHVGTKVEGVKVMRKKHRQGWIIPSLIKRKTK